MRVLKVWMIKGEAYGLAFSARMFGDNPELSEETRKAYRWAEEGFIKLARGEVSEEGAILGYGG